MAEFVQQVGHLGVQRRLLPEVLPRGSDQGRQMVAQLVRFPSVAVANARIRMILVTLPSG